MGLAQGAAVSVKWTGLATPGMVAVESFFALWFLKRSARITDLVVIAVIVLLQYHLWFYLHFWALPRPGEDSYDETTRTIPNFVTRMWKLNSDMLFGSASISSEHQWESKYYQWVLNLRGLLYYG